jgi:lipoyl(octanoyl) transferase
MPIENHCFRLLDSGPQEAFFNMAVDEAIAHAVETGQTEPTIRFYTWATPTLSIGAFQPVRAVNLDRCREMRIPVVRRITGGRALLHQAELTYSVICSVPSPFFPSNLQSCFRGIAEALRLGLEQLGLTVQVVSPKAYRQSKPHTPDCFSTPSLYELTVNGRKLVGSAQRRWLRAFLQHGSIPIRTERTLEKELIVGTNKDPAQGAVRLSELLDPVPSMEKLKGALAFGFEKQLGITLKKGALTLEEETQAQELVRTRYAADSWTYRR